jgi:hypothetical protein
MLVVFRNVYLWEPRIWLRCVNIGRKVNTCRVIIWKVVSKVNTLLICWKELFIPALFHLNTHLNSKELREKLGCVLIITFIYYVIIHFYILRHLLLYITSSFTFIYYVTIYFYILITSSFTFIYYVIIYFYHGVLYTWTAILYSIAVQDYI